MRKTTILLLFILSGAFSNAQTISKGPYLVYPFVNTQMTVLWQLSATSPCIFQWGSDTTYSQGNAVTTEYSDTSHQHKYTINSLTPGALYYYKVSFNTTVLKGSFRAAPDSSAKKVSFYAWGDTRHGSFYPNKISTQINAEINAHPEYQTMIVHAGDWSDSDADSSWANQFFSRTNADQNLIMHSSLPQMGARGNHEGAALYYNMFFPYNYQAGGCYYSYDYGPVHITVIDQYIPDSIGTVQYNWLVNDLSSSTKKWKIILLHEPGLSAGGGHPNNASVMTLFQPLCIQYHVSMVMAGHNHYYARAVDSNVVHLTIGGGGGPAHTPLPGQPNVVTYSAGLNYMRFDFDNDTLHAFAMNDSGVVIDSYTLINTSTSISDNKQLPLDIRIIPNPSAGQFDFYCNHDLKGCNFEIFNEKGQLIKTVHNTSVNGKASIDISSQSDGVFFLKTIIKGVPISSKLLLIRK